jgi:hypothetical protein
LNLLWIEIKELFQFFSINQHTIISLPLNTLIKTNSKKIRGKCYAITPLLVTDVDFIYYFKEPLINEIFNMLTLLDSKKINTVKQIKSQKNEKLLGYRINTKPSETI